ncbi:MAG TPA: hypothetical protein VFT34_06555 [Verrucomicrobiae bacterium]|nr:hypothetical protein [Verrucomicrobiae bacterium]
MTAADIRDWRRWMEKNPLAVALLLSLVIHLALLGGWRVAQKMGWWNHHASWLVKLTQKLAAAKPRFQFPLQPKPQPPPPQNQEIPTTFLEVDPATAVDQAPEKAKFYSDKNALASNPEPETKPTPKIDGQQDQVVRVMEQEKPLPFPLQPAPPKPKVDDAPKPGDLALNRRPDPKPPSPGLVDKGDGQTVTTPTERVRTLVQARQKAMLSGRLVKQEGGAERRGRVAFDTKATEFGEYDREFIEAVQSRWYYLIENNMVTPRAGKVILEFKLTHDGRITDMKIQDNEVGDILGLFCRNAVEDNQRYKEWPDEMRRKIGLNPRDIRFTFYYN